MKDWISKNCGLSAQDPEYDYEYDEEEDYLAYEIAIETQEDWRREEEYEKHTNAI